MGSIEHPSEGRSKTNKFSPAPTVRCFGESEGSGALEMSTLMKSTQRHAALPIFALSLVLGVAGCNKTPDQSAAQSQSGQDQGDPANANLAPVSDAGGDSTAMTQGSSGNESSAAPRGSTVATSGVATSAAGFSRAGFSSAGFSGK